MSTSISVSLLDIALNLIVGLITGSAVILSQALQGTSDLVTAGVVYQGVRRSKRRPDSHHPFGYGREIFFWVLVAGIFMFLGTGVVSFYLGYSQITDPQPISNGFLGIVILFIGLMTNSYSLRVSLRRLQQSDEEQTLWTRLINSSLIETKATLLVDLMGTVAAALGLTALSIYALTKNVFFDGAGAMAVGIAMMLASILLIRDVKELIVGKAVSKETMLEIKDAALTTPDVVDVLDLRTMYLGSSKLLVIIEVHLKNGLSTKQIENRTDKIKDAIKQNVKLVHHVQVEIETPLSK